MLTRLFVIFGGLFVLVLLAALVVPPFVDWTGYRSDFEREASAILGRKVTVRGEARARLLPFPSVTFSDVSVAGGPGGEPAMTVETFSMDAELAPFLRGEVLIFDMRLVRPKAVMDIAADGTMNWAVRPSSPFDPAQVSIEKLTITEGEVLLDGDNVLDPKYPINRLRSKIEPDPANPRRLLTVWGRGYKLVDPAGAAA